MGSFYLILGLVFSLIIAIVALANQETVTVSYIFGRADVSLILLIIGSAAAGALAMGLFSLFRGIRSAIAYRQVRRRQEALEKQVKDLEEEKLFLEAELNKYTSITEEEFAGEEGITEPADESEIEKDNDNEDEEVKD